MLPLGTFWGWTPWEDQNLFLTPKCTTTIPVIFIWESPRGCKPGSGGSRTFSLTQLMANAVENYLIAPIFLDIADLLLSNYAKNKVFRQKGRNKFYLKSLRQNAIDIIPGNVTGRKETAAFAFVISQTNSGLKWQPYLWRSLYSCFVKVFVSPSCPLDTLKGKNRSQIWRNAKYSLLKKLLDISNLSRLVRN